MTVREPPIVVVRHGATEWSEASRHTGLTDLPLLPEGREQAQALTSRLDPGDFERVLCSPLRRARETCALAGFGERMEIVEDLHEWDYGDYEGLTTAQIHDSDPDWDLWRDGCPGGESAPDVAARVDNVLAQIAGSHAIAFAHGHCLRVFAARWLGLGPEAGALLLLLPATVSQLGHEHGRRVIERWNVGA
jgi:broad specificity phosphatase PhoE